MKKKLRELRRKREFVRLCKGALRISRHSYDTKNITIKRIGENTNLTKCDFVSYMKLIEFFKKWTKAKVKAKAKKRGGKNVI